MHSWAASLYSIFLRRLAGECWLTFCLSLLLLTDRRCKTLKVHLQPEKLLSPSVVLIWTIIANITVNQHNMDIIYTQQITCFFVVVNTTIFFYLHQTVSTADVCWIFTLLWKSTICVPCHLVLYKLLLWHRRAGAIHRTTITAWPCIKQKTAGIAQWFQHWIHDWKVAGSNHCRSGGRIFFSRVNFLCWLISVSVPLPCYCSST